MRLLAIIITAELLCGSIIASTSVGEARVGDNETISDSPHHLRTKRAVITTMITIIGVAGSFATLFDFVYNKVDKYSHAELLENFKEVKNDLKMLTYTLNDLDHTIKEQGALTSIHHNEEKIRNGLQLLLDYLGAPNSKYYTRLLLTNGPDVKMAIQSLFRSLTSEQVTMKNLLRIIMDKEKCYFGKIHARSSHFVQLIEIGVKVYATCTAIMNHDARDHERARFTKYLNESGLALEKELVKIQETCNDESRLPEEIERILRESTKLSKEETAKKLWSHLTQKFYRVAGKTAAVVSWPRGQTRPKLSQSLKEALERYKVPSKRVEYDHANHVYKHLSDYLDQG